MRSTNISKLEREYLNTLTNQSPRYCLDTHPNYAPVYINLEFVHIPGPQVSGTRTLGLLYQNLSQVLHIYAINLPGFGRSHINQSWTDLPQIYQDYIDLIPDVLKEFIQTKLSNEHVYLGGHSFGGYIAVKFASRYPEHVKSLISFNPAGMFPTMGKYGMYWAFFFYFSVMRILRGFGRLVFFFRVPLFVQL